LTPTPPSALRSTFSLIRDIDRVHTPHIVQESLSAGRPSPIATTPNFACRLALESNRNLERRGSPKRLLHGGSELKAPIRYILSYALPHRGFATSGDRPSRVPISSTGKAIPISPAKFTGESDSLHAQWIIVDLPIRKADQRRAHPVASPMQKLFKLNIGLGTNALHEFRRRPERRMESLQLRQKSRMEKVEQQHSFLAGRPVSTRYVRRS